MSNTKNIIELSSLTSLLITMTSYFMSYFMSYFRKRPSIMSEQIGRCHQSFQCDFVNLPTLICYFIVVAQNIAVFNFSDFQ